MAHSNQEYVRKFEELKLGIEGLTIEHVDDPPKILPKIGAIEREPSATTRSLPGAPNRKVGRMRFATGGLPLQENESTRSLGSRELTTATRSPPRAQSNVTRSLAASPNAAVGNVFINTSVQTNIAMPPVQERGIPTTEAPTAFEQEALLKQLEHYSMLIKNLLKEVDEAQYKITFKSRLRVKGGIAGLHESERQELERIWGGTALQSAEQRLESLVEGLGEMPMKHRVSARDLGKGLPPGYMQRKKSSLPMTADFGLDNKEQEEAAGWIPQPIPDGRLSHLNSGTRISNVEDPSNIPTPVNEAVAKESRLIGVSEDRRTPSKMTAGAFRRDYSVTDPEHYLPDKKNIKPSNPVPSASTDTLRSEEVSTSLADEGTKPAKVMTPGDMKSRTLGRKNVKGLALSVPPSAGNAKLSETPYSFGGQSPQGVPQFYGPTNNELTREEIVPPVFMKRSRRAKVAGPWIEAQAPTARRDVEGTDYQSVGNLGRRTGDESLDQTQNLYGQAGMPKDARLSTFVELGEDQSAKTQPVEGKDDTALGEEFRQSEEELAVLKSRATTGKRASRVYAHHSSNHHEDGIPPVVSQLPSAQLGSNTSPTFAKISAPTYIPQSIPEVHQANMTLDPSEAAVVASTGLSTAAMGGSQPSTTPSPAKFHSPSSSNSYANQPNLQQRIDYLGPLTAHSTKTTRLPKQGFVAYLRRGQRSADSVITKTEPQGKSSNTEEGGADIYTQPKTSPTSVSSLHELVGEQKQAAPRQGTHAIVSDRLKNNDRVPKDYVRDNREISYHPKASRPKIALHQPSNDEYAPYPEEDSRRRLRKPSSEENKLKIRPKTHKPAPKNTILDLRAKSRKFVLEDDVRELRSKPRKIIRDEERLESRTRDLRENELEQSRSKSRKAVLDEERLEPRIRDSRDDENDQPRHDPSSDVNSNMDPGPDPDLLSHLDDSLEWPPLMVEASGPTHPPYSLSPSALAKNESQEAQRAASAAKGGQDPHINFDVVDSVLRKEQVEPWQRESEQGESRLADMEVADRLVLLWTTVKPL